MNPFFFIFSSRMLEQLSKNIHLFFLAKSGCSHSRILFFSQQIELFTQPFLHIEVKLIQKLANMLDQFFSTIIKKVYHGSYK